MDNQRLSEERSAAFNAAQSDAAQSDAAQSTNVAQSGIASFLLRFTQERWEDATSGSHVRWRGHIRHVQGDTEDRFTDFAAAVAFMQRNLAQLTFDTLAGGRAMSQEKVLRESFKLWEQFATTYTDLMVRSLEQAVQQSEQINKRISQAQEQALEAWRLPTAHAGEQKQVADSLASLQVQIASLTERIAALEAAHSNQDAAEQ